MRPLDLKLFRDLGQMKGQMTAVGLVMVCGLGVLINARSLIRSLEYTRDAYYRTNRLGEVFCELKRAPNAVRSRLAAIPGIAAVETRVRGSLILDIPGMPEPADGTVLSLPDDRPQQLNLLFLRTGRLPTRGARDEVVASEAFADAHGFEPGDTIDATIRGNRQRLRVVGIGLSPEFVIEARAGDIVPDSRRYGVFWMSEGAVADALDMDGAFNSVAASLAPGAGAPGVKASLERLLGPYGALVPYDRTEHFSARQLDDEIRNLRVFAIALPAIFLTISAFMTSAALARVVRLQREQIAQLKAFGYSSRRVGVHYLEFAMVVVLAATIAGTALGFWLGTWVVRVYREFFHFPSLQFHPDWSATMLALSAGAITSFLGVLGSVLYAAKLPPAQAMRPEPPADFRPSVFERIGLHAWVSPAFRMALRNMERKPWQALFTAVGLVFATAIPFVPGAARDGITYLMDFQYSLAQRQDATLRLIEPSSAGTMDAIRHLPGVVTAEPFRMAQARLRFGHRERRVGITGVPAGAQLNRVLNEEGLPAAIPPSGLLLSETLAGVLGAKPGDTVRIEVQEGRRPAFDEVIVGTMTDFAGMGVYMEIGALRRLLQEGGTISGAHVKIDNAHWGEFAARVKESPRVASLTTTDASLKSFKNTIGEMMGTIQGIYFTFAVIVAVGVVYNSARIALSERTRDLATLRVIGFTHGEVALVLIGELALLTLVAIPFGLVLGSELARLIVEASATETIRLPLVLTPRTYATAVLIVLLSSVFSFAVVSRRIHRLDLLAVLKAAE
jgi:putative ABC transport system permease protein